MRFLMVFHLNDSPVFPDPALADEDGLLAIGGDLSPERLLSAYAMGIFPWYSEGEPICWYSPHRRFVLFPQEVHVSHSMKQIINNGSYELSTDKSFAAVIRHCSKIKRPGQKGTWITEEMICAYIRLHELGVAHSVEVWKDGQLAGGLYGVETGKVFCGESMFSLQPNASKLALIALCRSGNYKLTDCQVHTAHLERMGARFISRGEFMRFLNA